jgi:hypothetical protein
LHDQSVPRCISPNGEYDEIRKSVTSFAEGFSLADIKKASFFAFLKEWGEAGRDAIPCQRRLWKIDKFTNRVEYISTVVKLISTSLFGG